MRAVCLSLSLLAILGSLLSACGSRSKKYLAPTATRSLRSHQDSDLEFEGPSSPQEIYKPFAAPKSFVFRFPVEDPFVISFYGWRGVKVHEGIDFRADIGTPVFAAAPGRVLYGNRNLKGFGKMILLQHSEEWSTLYAHLSRLDVREGDWVEGGEQIGLSGRTGRVRGPHLHFEMRKGADPVDPYSYLPF